MFEVDGVPVLENVDEALNALSGEERIGFDTDVAYPKMKFKPTRFLSEDEATAILQLRDSEDVRRILAESD